MLNTLQMDAGAIADPHYNLPASVKGASAVFDHKVFGLFSSLDKQLQLLGLSLKVYQAEKVSKDDEYKVTEFRPGQPADTSLIVKKDDPYAAALKRSGVLSDQNLNGQDNLLMSLNGRTDEKYLLVIEKETAAAGQHFQQKGFLGSLLNSLNPYLTMLKQDQQVKNILDKIIDYRQGTEADPSDIPKVLQSRFLAKPLHDISGDFHDHWQGPDGSLYLFLGDMTGHGLPAAYGAMLIKGYLAEYKDKEVPIEEIMYGLNNKLCREQQNVLTLMLTGILIKITPDGDLSYVSAGHPPLLIVPNSDKEQPPPQSNEHSLLPFGFTYDRSELSGAKQSYRLKDGDRLFVYTDGLTERRSAGGKLYGMKQFQDYMHQNKALGLDILVDGFQQNQDRFADGEEPDDDLTLIALEYTPGSVPGPALSP
jgi:hypothetical protein